MCDANELIIIGGGVCGGVGQYKVPKWREYSQYVYLMFVAREKNVRSCEAGDFFMDRRTFGAS